jgi:DNA-binding response OmpR family regulator
MIADDDKDLVDGLTWYLQAEGFEVSIAGDGETALEVFRRDHPDLAILDIMMPKTDGITVCETIRRESDAFIMMLSARDGEIDKVRALQIGADDYVTKPFHASELIARVYALLRRTRTSPTPASQSYRGRGVEVLFDERIVKVHGLPVELTATEFDMLSSFVRHPQTVFTRDRFVEILWNDDFYGDVRLVDNHIYHLREKLAKAGLTDFPIVTVRGVGYAYRPQD